MRIHADCASDTVLYVEFAARLPRTSVRAAPAFVRREAGLNARVIDTYDYGRCLWCAPRDFCVCVHSNNKHRHPPFLGRRRTNHSRTQGAMPRRLVSDDESDDGVVGDDTDHHEESVDGDDDERNDDFFIFYSLSSLK